MTDDLQTDQLIKSLERSDVAQRIGRAERIRWLSQYELPCIVEGEVELMNLLREARECFVNAHYIATLMLAVALIEHVISEELERVGKAKSNLDFKRAIELARCEALFPKELLDAADHLRELRNPFAHRRLSNREYTLSHRYITQQRHPVLILEEDARKAVAAMYGHFKHTLRPA